MAANETLGLRGPGRFARGFADAVSAVEVAVTDGPNAGVTVGVRDPEATGGVPVDSTPADSGGRHTGHFFASGESAATSTTSLAGE